jgi:hypothetical protein
MDADAAATAAFGLPTAAAASMTGRGIRDAEVHPLT